MGGPAEAAWLVHGLLDLGVQAGWHDRRPADNGMVWYVPTPAASAWLAGWIAARGCGPAIGRGRTPAMPAGWVHAGP